MDDHVIHRVILFFRKLTVIYERRPTCLAGAMRPYLKAWPGVSTDNSLWGIVHGLSGSMLKSSHSPTV